MNILETTWFLKYNLKNPQYAQEKGKNKHRCKRNKLNCAFFGLPNNLCKFLYAFRSFYVPITFTIKTLDRIHHSYHCGIGGLCYLQEAFRSSGCMKNAVCPLAVQAPMKGTGKYYKEEFCGWNTERKKDSNHDSPDFTLFPVAQIIICLSYSWFWKTNIFTK